MMEHLTPEYWKKINLDETDNKGIGFEKLVHDLLIAEYGKAAFQNTKHSWDGSKDFFYYSKQKNIWAECKNYSSNIDLKVLASTLIMAQISEIDTVLFYSYSPINVNTKVKLLINAEKKGKTIYFYDDIVLERKIFQYWDYIGEEYFPEFSYQEMSFVESEDNYETKCSLFGNPLDKSSSIDGYELKHLTLFKMFEMDICIINRKSNIITVSLGFKKIETIKAQFEFYPEHIIKSKMIITLAPYEGKNIKLWLIPIKENIILPFPYIDGKRLTLPKNVEFKPLKIRNNKRLIGQSYEQCLIDFKQKVLFETNMLKIGVFYGHSGTGKSRLYEECLNISKINGYEIIDFCSILNADKEPSIQDFIQKILINIYDISLDALEQFFNVFKFSTKNDPFFFKQPEYRMLADIFSISNDKNLKDWLNKYLHLIILKLAKNKFVFAIDNIQFFDDHIIELIDEICNRLISIKYCNTKILLTFNVDYIKRNSKVDVFLGNYTSNHYVSFIKHIRGFENSQECFEFLQELFSIGDVFQTAEINSISENLNKNPFYLEQMIYWLQDKHALEEINHRYIIKNEFLLKRLIRNIPNSVYDLLTERWAYYKRYNKSDYEKACILISAIHLYKELEKCDIDNLNITWDVVKELEKIGFIAVEDTFNTITISLRHDLIDKFFSKMYSPLSKKIIDYENKYNISLRNNSLRYYLGILYTEKTEFYLSNEQISEILTLHIDTRIAYEFYLLVFNKFLKSFDHAYLANKIDWINNAYQILVFIHDILGNIAMKKCVDTLLFRLKDNPDMFHYVEYGKLLLYISEAYDSMGNYREAAQIIKNFKDRNFGIKEKISYTFEQKKLLSEIYNRLHVYYRHQVLNPLDNKEIMNYLNLSAKIADEISDVVMQYVNYSDRGYLYYDFPLCDENHVKTILYWEKACEIYEGGGAEVKELNYLRKKVQLALLNGEADKAIFGAETGLERIDTSVYAYQQTFFKWWFYHALAEGYLLNYNSINAMEIEKALEHAHFYSDLLESNKKFYYLQLRSVYMYYLGKRDVATILNNEAITLVETSNYIKKKNSLKKQLLENGTVLISISPKPQDNLYSQIHTTDLLFNLPCM